MDKKIKTVIASVLKPVDDTRMFEKFGLSLQQTNRYEVNIIGFRSKNIPQHPHIRFFPIYDFGRLSPGRLFAPLSFLKMLLHLRPQLVIITTYELIWPAVLFSSISNNCHLVYDIQENYAANIRDNQSLGKISNLFAKLVSNLQMHTQPWVSLNILAEEHYMKELFFLRKPNCLVLNKYSFLEQIPVKSFRKLPLSLSDAYPVILFSGTVSKNYGIEEAVSLVKLMTNIFSRLKLLVIGHLTDPSLADVLNRYSFVINLAETEPVPHTDILETMKYADFGIVSHRTVKSIANCFPTRIYELMAHKIPILVRDHPYWADFCIKRKAGIAVNFEDPDLPALAKQINADDFYPKGVPFDIFWDSEEKKLIKALDQLFNINS
jgi:glycosyltransferase involved in cell wall biosynthesis